MPEVRYVNTVPQRMTVRVCLTVKELNNSWMKGGVGHAVWCSVFPARKETTGRRQGMFTFGTSVTPRSGARATSGRGQTDNHHSSRIRRPVAREAATAEKTQKHCEAEEP